MPERLFVRWVYNSTALDMKSSCNIGLDIDHHYHSLARGTESKTHNNSPKMALIRYDVATYLRMPGIATVLYVLAVSLFLYTVGKCIYNKFFHPLAKFPGPFLGGFTDWYLVYVICSVPTFGLELHKKYGNIQEILSSSILLTPDRRPHRKARAKHAIIQRRNHAATSLPLWRRQADVLRVVDVWTNGLHVSVPPAPGPLR